MSFVFWDTEQYSETGSQSFNIHCLSNLTHVKQVTLKAKVPAEEDLVRVMVDCDLAELL